MGVMSMSCVMKTKIVPRDDVKVMPSITALHGAKGVLGNQEIGGGLQFCIIEEVCDGDCKHGHECGEADGRESFPDSKELQGRCVGGV